MRLGIESIGRSVVKLAGKLLVLSIAMAGLWLFQACGGDSIRTPSGCTPGRSVACVGANGCEGYQVCADDGASFQPCECLQGGGAGGSTSGASVTTLTSVTGDGSGGTGAASVTTLTNVTGSGSSSSGAACAAGMTQCSGGCRNLMFDDTNCGACGNACQIELGHTCLGGACGCSGDVIVCPDGRCVSAFFPDPNLCGGCEVCAQGTECVDGVCQ